MDNILLKEKRLPITFIMRPVISQIGVHHAPEVYLLPKLADTFLFGVK